MEAYAIAIVIKARDAEEAQRFAGNMLCGGTRWDHPLDVPYVGEGCEVGDAARYETAEVHLLCDGMRTILAPEGGA
jgi:hypothetical protein